MLRAFLEAVRDGKDVPVAAEEGRYAVELYWAALTIGAQVVRWRCQSHRMYPRYATD